MNIFIRYNGTVFSLEVENSDSIENVKAKIQDETGIPPSQQTLYYNGVLLEDGYILADYSVVSNSTLILVTPQNISQFNTFTFKLNKQAVKNIRRRIKRIIDQL